MNTVEVKTPKIFKKTLQGEKVDPDDDQSLKGRDSSVSVLSRSRSPEFSKVTQQVSNTTRPAEDCISQDEIKQRSVEQVVNTHAQHDVHAVKMDGRVQIIKNIVQRTNPIIQEKINQVRCRSQVHSSRAVQKPWKSNTNVASPLSVCKD